jgi:hypothetical protein
MSEDDNDHAAEDDTAQWWVAAIGDTLIWARMTITPEGIAEVFDSDGGTLRYDDEAQARMALLDAEFRAFDGLDDDDAAGMGFDLEDIEPPRGDSDDELLRQMVVKI